MLVLLFLWFPGIILYTVLITAHHRESRNDCLNYWWIMEGRQNECETYRPEFKSCHHHFYLHNFRHDIISQAFNTYTYSSFLYLRLS